jgi:SNF2 family DNA or RNA helicase
MSNEWEESDESVPSIEELEAIFNNSEAEFATFFKSSEDTKGELTQLIEQEKLLMEQIQAVQRRKREIERERFNRQAELEKKERIVREAKHKLDEAKRFRTMEQEKASNFQLMVDKAKAANYEWVQYAKPHQWEGALSLAHYGSAILADETGLGKTLTSIMSLDLKESKKVLILTESNIASNFYTEILTYAPHRNLIPIANVTKGMRATIKTLVENSNEFVVVTNYESLWRDDKWLAGVDWDDIFIDEAHNAKNEKGLTFNAIDGFNYKNCTPITATYILNSPGDLYAPLHLIDPVAFNDK